MRLLHTSDWHLGRSLHREDLLPAQARFVDVLVDTVRAERVDAVVVSGDVYDRALPSVDAVALCNDALRRLAASGTTTLVISGNHDSWRRLGFAADLIEAAGVHLRTRLGSASRPVLVEDTHGPVALYGVPYLEPAAVAGPLGCTETSHGAAMAAALQQVRADLRSRPGTRSVVAAHAFVVGGEGCESERELTVGGSGLVPAALFAPFSYAALGHLHGPQQLAETVRYSGSPLAYSFSEEHHRKGMWLVELGAQGVQAVERVELAGARPLRRVRGRLDDLLHDPAHAELAAAYLQVTLTDPVRPREPMERLRARFPHTLVLSFEPDDDGSRGGQTYAQRLHGLDDLTVAGGFVEHVRGGPAAPAELALLAEAFDAARLAEAAV